MYVYIPEYWVYPEDTDLSGYSAEIPLTPISDYDMIVQDYGWTKVPTNEEN